MVQTYILALRINNFPRIEDILRVERPLYTLHSAEECVGHLYRKVLLLIKADAVLS